MATDDKKTEAANATLAEATTRAQAAQLDILLCWQRVAEAELAKGPGVSSQAWRDLYDAIARALGDEPIAQAVPVAGRQPLVVPPGFKNPIPAKGGATPTRPDQPVIPTAADIRHREDVAAELERVKRGGK